MKLSFLKRHLLIFTCCISLVNMDRLFSMHLIRDAKELERFIHDPSAVLIASSGRSGSSMLIEAVENNSAYHTTFKTHVLPPEEFEGKIIFIFSNPDLAAESALHVTLKDEGFGYHHFHNICTSDLDWLKAIGSTTRQTLKHNLLAYDALGCRKQLMAWLHLRTIESQETARNSQVLTIKYENLWDAKTILAIQDFLGLDHFALPAKKKRGYAVEELDPREIIFKNTYNLGTNENPVYRAYDGARYLWKIAAPFELRNLSGDF